MLTTLRIESFAIVDSLEIRFGPGLNVVTGETGAGKSILVGALELVLGGRADPEIVRAGRDEAVVEALFAGDSLAERARGLGLPVDGEEVLIRRVVARKGRGRVYVNGSLATVGLLGQLTAGLVELASQHDSVSLLDKENHLDLLDRFGGTGELREAYLRAYETWRRLIGERDRLVAQAEERLRRKDYLSFLLQEIDEIAPRVGEDEQVEAERQILASAERLAELASEAERWLGSGENAAVDSLGLALRRLEDGAHIDPSLAPHVARLSALQGEVQDVAQEIASYARGIEADPQRLASLEERQQALHGLCRKHGGSLAAVLERREEMERELATLEGAELRLGALDEQISEAWEQLRRGAERLGAARREAAERLEATLQPPLARLGLGTAALELRFHAVEAEEGLGPRGAEEVEFYFCANPGEEARPLAKVASGGELSRILLALKQALAHVDPVRSWIFDEIDSGIGGATGLVIGEMLREAAKARQVLCVTHLPQVAAHADRHIQVAKATQGGRTSSRVAVLEGKRERQRILAEMLAGSPNQAALAAAAELLEGARGRKRQRARPTRRNTTAPGVRQGARTAAALAAIESAAG